MEIRGQSLKKIKSLSSDYWRKKFGRMHYRNNFILEGSVVYFGTCGNSWNRSDENDAVWAVEAENGEEIWKASLKGDCNSICSLEKYILCGTDSGHIVAIDKDNGTVKAEYMTGTPVVAGPKAFSEKQAAIVTQDGSIIIFDCGKCSFSILHMLEAEGNFLNMIVDFSDIYAGTDKGELVRFNALSRQQEVIFRAPSVQRDSYVLEPTEIASLSQNEKYVFISYTRDTYDQDPPLACWDKENNKLKWHAAGNGKDDFGNCRVSPVVIDGMVLCTFSYSEFMTAFSLETGKIIDAVRLDHGPFQNWSSPFLMDGMVFVSRVNGVVMKVDPSNMTLRWTNAVEKIEPRLSLEKDRPSWPSRSSGDMGPHAYETLLMGITATPTGSNGRLFVGTVSGEVVCLKV